MRASTRVLFLVPGYFAFRWIDMRQFGSIVASTIDGYEYDYYGSYDRYIDQYPRTYEYPIRI